MVYHCGVSRSPDILDFGQTKIFTSRDGYINNKTSCMYAKTILTLDCQKLNVKICQNRPVPSNLQERISDWEGIYTP